MYKFNNQTSYSNKEPSHIIKIIYTSVIIIEHLLFSLPKNHSVQSIWNKWYRTSKSKAMSIIFTLLMTWLTINFQNNSNLSHNILMTSKITMKYILNKKLVKFLLELWVSYILKRNKYLCIQTVILATKLCILDMNEWLRNKKGLTTAV